VAEIVFGFGVSHGPLLVTPPEKWGLRYEWDKRQPQHYFRGKAHSFDELVRLRDAENFAKQITLAVKTERFNRCRRRIAELGQALREKSPDVLVVAGDDQREWIMPDIQPAFTVFHGESVTNLAFDEQRAKEEPSVAYRMQATEAPGGDQVYPVQSDLAVWIIEQLCAEGFDVAASAKQPAGPAGPRQLGHAWGFVYRQLLEDVPIPLVPVLINTFYPPNRPSPKRCFEFGRAIGRAIRRWDSPKTIAIGGSGGLSHFVIDERFDREVLEAMQHRDLDFIFALDDSCFRAGTSEIKNWLVAAGMLAETRLEMNLLDYVPCYRSEAGTGCAMGFATWT
jgi:Catalytic LigB subunit of aromatic ring-opening dioxygenase